ncbi:MAG: hypothetical protein HW421_1201 [Ignavibacteria bacterium]|nr:hypothetical protein [Ignavibacteria bacterium]
MINLMDYYNELSDEAAKKILKCTVQIFKRITIIEPIALEPYASGVLVQLSDRFFMVTASHVIDTENLENLGILIDSSFTILNGKVVFSKSEKDKELDQVDIAVWELAKEVVVDLQSKFTFLDLKCIDINHAIVTDRPYLLVGYPISRTKIIYTLKKVKSEPFVFTTKASNIEYTRLNCNKNINIVLDYEKEKILGEKTKGVHTGPDPYGISGSGIWYLPKLIYKDIKNVEPHLIGILHTWVEAENVIIGSKMNIINELIIEKFNIDIPHSSTIGLS